QKCCCADDDKSDDKHWHPLGHVLLICQNLPAVSVLRSLGLQMASSASSHSTSGLRSPVLASAMSLSAMVRLTCSSSSPVLRAMQAILRAMPRARLVSRSK